MSFVITTDTMSDLPESYIIDNRIPRMSLTYTMDGQTYNQENTLSSKDFYDKMRQGATPTTSQVNPEDAVQLFEKVLSEQDGDILHIAFSSGLSGSYNSARIAAEELLVRYPDRKILVVDSLAASLGQGLLIHKALEMQKGGATIGKVHEWLEENKLHLCHVVTVDDLIYLYRGGRVSRTTAFLGGALGIKPMIHVDNEGRLIPYDKVRGRRKSLASLVEAMEKQMGAYRDQNDVVFISHADALEDAQMVAGMIRERYGIKNFLIDYIGPTIGAHTGPGCIALFFMGVYR